MKFLILFLTVINLCHAAYPKVFDSHGKVVYPYIDLCKSVKDMKSELGRVCKMFHLEATANLDAGYLIDARRDTIKAGDPLIKKYIKTIQSLRRQKEVIREEVVDAIKQAIHDKDAKAISILFVLPHTKYKQKIYRKIAKLNLKLSRKAKQKLQNYLDVNRPRKSESVEKSSDIRAKKNETLRGFTCVELTQMGAIKAKKGMIKAIVAGKTKGGYILEVLGGKHFFLTKSGLSHKYEILESVDFEAQGKGRPEKVSYSYSDGVGSVVRKSETLPVIAYIEKLKKICKDK